MKSQKPTSDYSNSFLESAVSIKAGIPNTGQIIAEAIEPASASPQIFRFIAYIPPNKASIPGTAGTKAIARRIGTANDAPMTPRATIGTTKKRAPTRAKQPEIMPRTPATVGLPVLYVCTSTLICSLTLYTRKHVIAKFSRSKATMKRYRAVVG